MKGVFIMGKIIAIVGMCGSGKSIASDYLEKRGFTKIYFGGVTMEKLKEKNLSITPENEKMMREKLREDLGMGAFAKILLPRILELSKTNDLVLDGLYSWDEYKILNEELGNSLTMVAIIVDKKIRYERLAKRDIRPLTKKEAMNRDISEIENIAKAPPIAYADYYIFNNGSLEEYENRLEKILKEI